MQRLLSFKIVSDLPRLLPNNACFLQSRLCKSVVKGNPKQLHNSSVTEPFSFFSLNFSGLWRSQQKYYSVSEKIHGFLQNPVLVKEVSSTHLRIISSISNVTRHLILRGRRSWSRMPNAEEMVLGLIVANIAVFMLWRIADPMFMNKNFMVENFTSGHVHTLITSAFSHKDVAHIMSNMFGLYIFGTNTGKMFGPAFLLKLYLAGAVGGSIFFLVHHTFLASKRQGEVHVDPSKVKRTGMLFLQLMLIKSYAFAGLRLFASHGASGAVNAIMLLNIFLFPNATLYFDLVFPVPAFLVGAILVGKDMWIIMEGNSQISGSAHLGGAAVAALVWARIKK